MKHEAELRRRLRSLETLGSAIAAMKWLSARQFREARAATVATRPYRDGIERIARASRASIPAGDGGAGVLVIGAELGVCGSYGAQLVGLAASRRAELGAGPTLCFGRRTAAQLERRGVRGVEAHGSTATIDGIQGVLFELADVVLRTYFDARLSRFEVVSSVFDGVGSSEPSALPLLPIGSASPAESDAPARYASRDHLAAVAGRELLYTSLHLLLLDALASEHAARLLATRAAADWIDERSEAARRALTRSRSETATQEMIEIAVGSRGAARRARERG